MKVKHFVFQGFQDPNWELESMINQWLEKNPIVIVDIKYQAIVRLTDPNHQVSRYSALVLYEDQSPILEVQESQGLRDLVEDHEKRIQVLERKASKMGPPVYGHKS